MKNSGWQEEIKEILKEVSLGKIKVEEALEKLKILPYLRLGSVCLDTHRALRKGFAEAIYCPGKTEEQLIKIAKAFAESKTNFLATKAGEKDFEIIKKIISVARYHPQARLVTVSFKKVPKKGLVLVISGGAADQPIAEEAAITAEFLGNRVKRAYDVGIAGLHRLFSFLEDIQKARAIVVVAGMEGALPSLISGLASAPVIAVPTSVGYGANFNGLAPLLTMLNSCAEGLAIVNIDNGFGAGYFASLINLR